MKMKIFQKKFQSAVEKMEKDVRENGVYLLESDISLVAGFEFVELESERLNEDVEFLCKCVRALDERISK